MHPHLIIYRNDQLYREGPYHCFSPGIRRVKGGAYVHVQ